MESAGRSHQIHHRPRRFPRPVFSGGAMSGRGQHVWHGWRGRPWEAGKTAEQAEIGVRLSPPHEMTRTRTLEHGVEEWSCTECSRRLLFRWPPEFEKIVLDRGDQWAAHVGGSGGVHLAAADVTPPERTDL